MGPGLTIAAMEVALMMEPENEPTITTEAPQGVERACESTVTTEAPQGAERAGTREGQRQSNADENDFEEDANSRVKETTTNTLYESVMRFALVERSQEPELRVERVDFMPPCEERKEDVTRTPDKSAVTVEKTTPEGDVVGNADSESDTEEDPAGTAHSDRSREHNQPHLKTQQGQARAALRTLNEDAELAHLERVGSVTNEPSEAVNNENDGEGLKTVAQAGQGREDDMAPPYKRLFTPEELDALTDGRTLDAKEEKEEYDKELEERLIPLDEVELLKKRSQNAAKQKELTLEELSALLNLPVATLERTRESSPGVLSTPEYWIDWYRRTLAASEEARRANRDFREKKREKKLPPISSLMQGDSDARDVGGGNDFIGDEILALPKKREPHEPVATDEKVVRRNICVTFAVPIEDEPSEEENCSNLPSRWRALVRTVVYQMVLEDEARAEPRCRSCRKSAAYLPSGECRPVELVTLSEAEREPRARELVIAAAGVLGDSVMTAVTAQILDRYESESPLMRTKRADRQQLYECQRAASDVLFRRHRSRREVHYDCTSLFCRRSEAIGSNPSLTKDGDDISHYLCSVRDPDGEIRLRKPGLVGVEDADAGVSSEDDPVPAGEREICSVGGVDAVSVGYIEDLPAELLIDSGAIASLVESRVLTRLGLKDAPLRSYHGSRNAVSGHKLRVKGEIDLPLRLGSLEKRRPFVVVDHLHVDAILGTDSLKAFRAVIDLDEKTMALKDSGEVFPLGAPRVEETYVSRIASTVRLCPCGQALVAADIMGKAQENATVLIEGLPELEENVRVARTLCSIRKGKAIVEVCNASTEELVIKKGTALAVATFVPKSAFASVDASRSTANPSGSSKSVSPNDHSRWVDAVIGAAVAEYPVARDPMPGLKDSKGAELGPDFSDSKLGKEQQGLMKGLLDTFRAMFVETSLKPGRTHLLEFSIDTGTNPPIQQPPYRVSHAEGDVMESEIQQYLELGLIRPSTSP
ncbi:uncharacterized protein IUM83_03316 [Phytophthora cinnamomi]|uniref:uncharacterized protein n=1 Tax=Phytophthora cinnamomi TaxID=4785 RepID=UPI003559A437|nr:hypothetical protein IUM83_03316 [Phytophthora cinnamomi]